MEHMAQTHDIWTPTMLINVTEDDQKRQLTEPVKVFESVVEINKVHKVQFVYFHLGILSIFYFISEGNIVLHYIYVIAIVTSYFLNYDYRYFGAFFLFS